MDTSDQSLYAFLKDKGLANSSSGASSTEASSTESPGHVPKPGVSEEASSEDEGGPKPLLDFDHEHVGERLRQANERQLDAADFGIVRVDNEGRVRFYNEYESRLANVAPEDAEGQNFFTELAPCSNNRIFLGRFKKGVRTDDLDASFTYTFTYKMRPTLVDIRLYRDEKQNNWVMVRKR